MFEGEAWFEYLDEPMQEQLNLSYLLLDREEMNGETLTDYAFVVFPMARAYEGFVKKYLFDLGLISKEDMLGKIFRIGKSMNPSLPEKWRNHSWVFERMQNLCAQKDHNDLPMMIWDAWKKGRNEIFHYFVGDEKPIDLNDAKERIELMKSVMQKAVECRRNLINGSNEEK